ncbi:MAG: hypothetical protein LKG96_10585 [Acetobacter fabarum]|uniref:hypothetical protein n=1 Tax=Acetobacter fabarum TaxID=483199 RepID=UPI00242C2E9C|nr:hypothetical protein [Acetobacter fabarum]MCH4025240.1 hypothetical protein [Acetobacter fabarum]MCI1420698.1 hypothetical protein [Acetobacter fabarum]MCI1447082.1 hypothetical protein [Acetobacter fabarum]MCI1629846.1 hypothetical protein [Acetobacter fabarum]
MTPMRTVTRRPRLMDMPQQAVSLLNGGAGPILCVGLICPLLLTACRLVAVGPPPPWYEGQPP